ncbi:MAG TPA: DUF4189 domain-containing protein [Candidimonas sp.]|nr:DUF4189 domain-containing protein [Candidimonas sp.]
MKKTQSLLAAVTFSMALVAPFSAMAVGAIAVDDEAGSTDAGYALVSGYDSESSAKAAALKECRAAGNENCKIAVWFKTCGAYAASSEHYGIGYGNTKQIAESKAVEECGGGSCKVVVSDCE